MYEKENIEIVLTGVQLKKKCIAHVNSDLIGSKKGKLVAVITTGLEDEKETIDMIRKIDADAPIQFKRFGRGADQSYDKI